MDVGTLRYYSTADVILGATASATFVVVVVIAAVVCLITVGCKQYKKRLSRAKAQNEQLQQEVINIESQVAMMHGQMRGNYYPYMHAHNGVNCIAVLLPSATYIVLHTIVCIYYIMQHLFIIIILYMIVYIICSIIHLYIELEQRVNPWNNHCVLLCNSILFPGPFFSCPVELM